VGDRSATLRSKDATYSILLSTQKVRWVDFWFTNLLLQALSCLARLGREIAIHSRRERGTYRGPRLIASLEGNVARYSRNFRFSSGSWTRRAEALSGTVRSILQTDGYAAYDEIGGPGIVHAACWAHSRRQFFEAVQLNPKDPIATPIVARMDELFAIDSEARRQELSLEARHALRQEQSRALLDMIRRQIEAAGSTATTGERAGQGLQLHAYALAKTQPVPGIPRAGVEQ
jgi:Transposase IS66 family